MRRRASRCSRCTHLALSLATGACLSVAQPARAQSQAAGQPLEDATPLEDLVWLEFAWPVGLSADVDMEQRMVRGEGGGESDVTMRSRYRMTVRDHPRGLAVDHSGATLVGLDAVPPLEAEDPLAAMYESLPELSSTFIVSDDGMLLDVEGLERGTEALRRALEPVSEELRDVPGAEAVNEMLAASLSVDAMKATAAELWASMVWFWAWEEFEPDSVYTFAAEVPSPVMPDLIVPMAYEVGFLRRVPCLEGAAADSCVHLEARTFPDPATMAGFIEDFAGRLASLLADTVALGVDAYEQENRFGVTLEPASMIPYEFRMSRRARVRLSVDGEPSTSLRIDETVLRFRYGAPVD